MKTPSPKLVKLGASSIKDGNVRYQCSTSVGNDNDDTDSYGECPVMQALGHAAMPWPADANGSAEGVAIAGLGSRKAIVIGARDTRSAKVVGKMEPGDTVLHSTDPDQTAQVRVQGKKKSASVVVKGKGGKHLMVLVDGENEKIQIMAKGAMIEIDDAGDISLLNKGGAGLLLQGGEVVVNGILKLPGMPPGHMIVTVPITQFPALVAAFTLVAMPGPAAPLMNVAGFT
jgi:hypothetical protein